MNYDFYKTFITLAETNNFSKAAEKLNIVQSTVSNRIQELEKYLDTTLFIRTNKSVVLTKTGLSFLPYAKRIVAIEEEGLNAINSLNYTDTIKIGTVHPFYSSYIKNAAIKFMKLNSNISLQIIVNHTPKLLEMLSDNLIDIGFVCTIPKSDKFICTNILKDEIILAVKNSSEYRDELSITDLKSIPLLYADTGDTVIKGVEAKLNCRLDFQLSINQMSEIIDYVREGFGYAFVLKSLVANWIQHGDIKKVKIKDINLSTLEGYVVVQENKMKNEAMSCFIKLLSNELIY